MRREQLSPESLENVLDFINAWIRGVDQKIGILLAFQGIILTLIIPNYLNDFVEKIITVSFLQGVFIVLPLGFMAIGIFKSTWGIISRTNKKDYPNSPLFFGDIATYTLQEYKSVMHDMTDEQYRNAVIEQIYINSKIATTKHVLFREAVVYFLIGFSLTIGSNIVVKLF